MELVCLFAFTTVNHPYTVTLHKALNAIIYRRQNVSETKG